MSPRTILLDFDSTVVYNRSPFIGEEIEHCVTVLKRLLSAGHQFVLYTMRADNLEDDAMEWFRNRRIEIKYVNCNPEYETGARKIYGHLTICDHCLGIPLKVDHEISPKPFVDWYKVEELLIEKGYI